MAVKEIISIDNFAQKLEIVLSDVVCTVEPKQIGPSDELGPFFNTLPREIRDMIFTDCLESGHPQFMACSRAMREEGLAWIWQKGVYRMNFGNMARMSLASDMANDPQECRQPTPEIANKIQNVSIRVKPTVKKSRGNWSNLDYHAIKQFGGSRIRRKFCRILLESRENVPLYIGDDIFDALEILVGFEKVELRVVLSGNTFPRNEPVPQESQFSHQTRMIYKYYRRYLRHTLCRADLGWDEEGHFINFIPR